MSTKARARRSPPPRARRDDRFGPGIASEPTGGAWRHARTLDIPERARAGRAPTMHDVPDSPRTGRTRDPARKADLVPRAQRPTPRTPSSRPPRHRPTWAGTRIATPALLADPGPRHDGAAFIHPDAEVSPGVSIGPRTRVWDRARVREGVTIGSDCIIGRGAYLDEGVQIGDRVKIQNNALVYHGVTVDDGVFIGPNAILTNDRFPRSITATAALSTAQDWVVSRIQLPDGRSIGAGAVVVAGARCRALRHRRCRCRRDSRCPRPRPRGRQPGPTAGMGVCLRAAPASIEQGRPVSGDS